MRQLSDFSSAPGFPRSVAVSRLAFALSLFAFASCSRAQEQSATSISREVKDVFERSATSISREVKDVFERSAKAVVKIHGADQHSEFFGTGFFIDPTGTLYTSYTVGGEAGNFTIEFDGKQYPAHQVLADVRSGLAILKTDLATPALPIDRKS